MFSVSGGFKTKADDPQEIEERLFDFNGTDYSEKLMDMGAFSQKHFEGDLPGPVEMTVTVFNDSKEFNFLKTKTNMGKVGTLKIGYAAEYVERYKGKLEGVEFSSKERQEARLRFVTLIQQTLIKLIGTSATPVAYTAASWNPADLAWDILTVHGEMDTTASTANTDIDYTSWLDFKSKTQDLGFLLKGNFSGQAVAEALRLIGELTDAVIYAETDSKIYFRKHLPEVQVPYTFDDTKAHLSKARMVFDKKRLRNQASVSYGYNTGTKTFAGTVTKDHAQSQTDHGIFKTIFDSVNVWHDTSASATNFADRYIYHYSDPPETVVFSTKRGTQALIHQVGDMIYLDWGQVDYASKLMRIYGIRGDLTPGKYEITAEEAAVLNKDFFILDSSTQGILDQNILY